MLLAALLQAATRTAPPGAPVLALTMPTVTVLQAPGLSRLSPLALKLPQLERAQPWEASAASLRAALDWGLLSRPCCESPWVYVVPRSSGLRRRSPQSKVPEPK